jgi:hypothetical protein
MLFNETGRHIFICDNNWEVIQATQPGWIGNRLKLPELFSQDAEEIVIDSHLAGQYRSQGFDVVASYFFMLNVLGKRIGSIGIAEIPKR